MKPNQDKSKSAQLSQTLQRYPTFQGKHVAYGAWLKREKHSSLRCRSFGDEEKCFITSILYYSKSLSQVTRWNSASG